METIDCTFSFFQCPNIWDVFAIITGIVALIISFGFLFVPKLKCRVFSQNNKIKVEVLNTSRFRKVLTEINCELSVSDDFSKYVKTLKLDRDWIISLVKSKDLKQPNYIFKTIDLTKFETEESLKYKVMDKKYLRIRFLVPNFIGIKKSYEDIILINDLKNPSVDFFPKKQC